MSVRLSSGTLDSMAGIFAPRRRKRYVSGGGKGSNKGGGAASGAFAAMAGFALRPSQAKVAFGSGDAARQSAHAVATLGRMARRVPEVVVRITGRQTGGSHVLANFTYISRLGHGEDQEVTLYTSDGDELHDGRSMQVLAQDWQAWETGDNSRRSGSTSISMILSMPVGVDSFALRDAALAFANEEMANRSWVAALHQDRDHPHVHLTIARRDHDGRRFHPDRDDLFRYRQVFAQKLRDHGIEANATPCRTRGVDPVQEHIGVIKMREQGVSPRVDVSRVERSRETSGLAADEPAAGHIGAQQRVIRSVYERSIAELAASPDPDHQAVARSLRSFVATMPAPEVNSEKVTNRQRGDVRSVDAPDLRAPDGPAGNAHDPVAAALSRAKALRESLRSRKDFGVDQSSQADAEARELAGPTLRPSDPVADGRGGQRNDLIENLLREARQRDDERAQREHDRSRDRDGPNR
jgi:hypothetical protein